MDNQNDNEIPQSPFSLVREVDTYAPLRWLKSGWEDFKSNPLPSLFYGICFCIGGYLLVWALRDAPHAIPAVITGFLIAAPFMAMGLYELSRCREAGEKASLLKTMMVWRSNTGNLSIFALILLVVTLIWARASMVVFALFYSGKLPDFKDFVLHIIQTDQIEFLLVFFGIGAMFALFTFAISLVSIPLMLDRGSNAVTAAITSAVAMAKNANAMIIWSGLITVLGMVGLFTFFLGIIVIGPLLGHATWHAYRDLVMNADETADT